MSIKALREKRRDLRIKLDDLAIRLGSGGISQTDANEWRRIKDDYDAVEKEVTDAEARGEVDPPRETREERDRRRSRAGGVPGLEERTAGDPRLESDIGGGLEERGDVRNEALCLQAWVRSAHSLSVTDDQAQACERRRFNPHQHHLDIGLSNNQRHFGGSLQKRALSVATGSSGGDTVPQSFQYQLEVALLQYCPLRQYADVMRTPDGRLMPYPAMNDTGNAGTLIDENTQVSEVDPSFSVVNFAAYKFTSGLVLVPNELLEDSAFNLGAYLANAIGERISRGEASYFTTGTGSSQPGGIVTGASAGITTASPTVIAPDEVLALIHSVDPAYRSAPDFALMMSDTVYQSMRSKKDGQGRYLFSNTGDPPNTLFGKPVVVNVNMSTSISAGEKVMLAGPMSKFKIRDAGPVRIMRLVERYADYDQVGFIAFKRSDSKVLDAGTHPLKLMTMAAS